MKLVKKLSDYQTLWDSAGSYYVCSTSPYTPEIMVFAANAEGDVQSYEDLYVSYDMTVPHEDHMKIFLVNR